MPTDTFFKLPSPKRDRVYDAAVEELCRVPFEQISIRNIVNGASIARGSFYQYFRDKEDLFVHVMNTIRRGIEDRMEEKEDLFDYIRTLAEQQLFALSAERVDSEVMSRLLRQVAASPGARIIFEREIGRNLRSNGKIHEKIRDRGFSRMSEPVRNALFDMISQSVKTAITEVLSREKEPGEALADLNVKLSIMKAGIRNREND